MNTSYSFGFHIMRGVVLGILSLYLWQGTVLAQQSGSSTPSAPSAKNISDPLQSGVFQRKSMTVLPLARGSDAYSFLLKSVNNLQVNNRFDQNILSATTIQNAEKAFQSVNGFQPDSVNSLSNEKALMEVIRSTGVLKEIIALAANKDSVNARQARMQKRIATSASAAKGISSPTGEQILALINGVFVGVPVLVKGINTATSVEAKGHIYWFRLQAPPLAEWKGDIPAPEQVALTLVRKREATGVGMIVKDNALTTLLSTNTAQPKNPVETAVDAFANQLFNLAYTMEEFKIRATIQQVQEGIKIDLGNREGAYLDQGYDIYETRMDANNLLSSHFIGFSRIGELGKTSEKMDALSTVYPIIPGKFDGGMTAVSHDQLIDVTLRPSLRTIYIPAKSLNGLLGANLINGNATTAYSLNLSLMYDIARFTGIPQLFVGADVGFGLLNSTANAGVRNASGTLSINTPSTFEASLGVMKKFWFAPLAGVAEVQFGINNLQTGGKIGSTDWKLEYGTLSFGAGLNVGLEYAITPDILAGVEVGYRAVLPVTTLKLTIGEKLSEYSQLDNASAWKTLEFDQINLGGLRFGLRISYSLPPIF